MKAELLRKGPGYVYITARDRMEERWGSGWTMAGAAVSGHEEEEAGTFGRSLMCEATNQRRMESAQQSRVSQGRVFFILKCTNNTKYKYTNPKILHHMQILDTNK